MDNRIDLSTIGVQLHYCVETTKGQRPTTGYTRIYGIKSTPSLNPSPDALETTTLDELEYKTYVDGLKDLGGALEFTFNLTEDLITKWEALITAYAAGKADGKRTWFCILVPGLTQAFYFPGNPSAMGLPETAVNSVLEITNYITPVGAPVKAPKPTGE
nr:MAG TPA: tail tube protein [Bacteriophage sp.]